MDDLLRFPSAVKHDLAIDGCARSAMICGRSWRPGSGACGDAAAICAS
jgi:hypothetical protein